MVLRAASWRGFVRPSFRMGYARNASESIAPQHWRGLVGAWCPSLGHTGNTLHDVSGYGRHALLVGSATAANTWHNPSFSPAGWVADNQNGFTGQHGWRIDTWPNYQSPITMMAWIRPDGGGGAPFHEAVIEQGNADPVFGIESDTFGAATQGVWAFANAADFIVEGPTACEQDEWAFIAVAMGQDSAEGYRNGILDDTGGGINFSSFAGTTLRLGMAIGWSSLQGSVDDFRFYNRQLHAAEIQEIYELGPGGMFILDEQMDGFFSDAVAPATAIRDMIGMGIIPFAR